ncbi:hypothetical protein RHMOL_Rhmol09G0187300 [Rhododendron molle]|uniref:Uncharacterized protein n=1 Tax=Rhododendron molle TaxID=49168 RepID=A0ACC0MGP3_RHOML|nr:hypothetical protein RHMOL_Rhmol09G0187300 [Rhododendron molle]
MVDLGSTRSVRRCGSSSLIIRSLFDRFTEELGIEVLQLFPLKDANRLLLSAMVCYTGEWRHVYLNDIFAYDPNKTANYQGFRTIILPKERLHGAYVHLFEESQGHLRYAEFDEGTFRVCELKEYSSGEWGLVHKFPQSELVVREEPNKLAKFKTRNSHSSIMMLAFHPIEGDVMFLDWHGVMDASLSATCGAEV